MPALAGGIMPGASPRQIGQRAETACAREPMAGANRQPCWPESGDVDLLLARRRPAERS